MAPSNDVTTQDAAKFSFILLIVGLVLIKNDSIIFGIISIVISIMGFIDYFERKAKECKY